MRVIKSPFEISVMKEAGEAAAMMAAAHNSLSAGAREYESALAVIDAGSRKATSVKPYEKFDPVYFCFCNMAQFKQYKLGFDRMFYIGDVKDSDSKVQQAAIDAQQAAIQMWVF